MPEGIFSFFAQVRATGRLLSSKRREAQTGAVRWAAIVAILYALMLAVLSLPVVMLAFVPSVGLQDAVSMYGQWQWWLWLVVMGLAQAALLAVPVRVSSRRPITRRPLALTIVAGALMMGGLVAGAFYSLTGFIFRDNSPDVCGWVALALGVVAWCAWALIFFRVSRSAAPGDFVSRLCKDMLRGSILELQIAVPTHIVARYRGDCCADVMTFIGLALGISVMLFSFGPGVLFLFVARWRRLHPGREAAGAQ
jgi:hypothetical protein